VTDPHPSGAGGGSAPELRIVSLLASATEILCALGLEDRIVGISHECDHPTTVLDRPRLSRPRFDPAGMTSGEIDRTLRETVANTGSVYEIDADTLAELQPDLILTQAVCDVCAVPAAGVREVVREREIRAEVLSLDAHTLEEILASVRTVGSAVGRRRAADLLVAELEARLARTEAAVRGTPPVGTLAIEWLDPPFAAGHWVPEMIARAGGTDLIGRAGERSLQRSWPEIRALDPDVLVVMPCGYDLEAARRDADLHAAELSAAAPRAIAAGRAYVVDASSYFNRSGPRVVTGVEILAGLLHPETADPPPAGTAARWAPPTG